MGYFSLTCKGSVLLLYQVVTVNPKILLSQQRDCHLLYQTVNPVPKKISAMCVIGK